MSQPCIRNQVFTSHLNKIYEVPVVNESPRTIGQKQPCHAAGKFHRFRTIVPEYTRFISEHLKKQVLCIGMLICLQFCKFFYVSIKINQLQVFFELVQIYSCFLLSLVRQFSKNGITLRNPFYYFKTLSVLCHDEEPFPGSEKNTNVPKKINIWRSSDTGAAHRLIHSRCTAKNQISF